jgi:hypothetical protein
MKSRTLFLALLSIIAISMCASLPAQAQRARVFVSVTGNDANPCTALSPCKTFQAAHDAVLAGGEISVLDTGGYGTLIINKAISIVAVGVEASIAIPSGAAGITVNAGPTDKVSLRGLTLDGAAVGAFGLQFNSGASFTVEDCVVRNMTTFGLNFVSNTTTTQTLVVSNSYFYDNKIVGIEIATNSSGAIQASVDRTGLHNNGGGGVGSALVAEGSSGTGALTVSVTDSVAANNNLGFVSESMAGRSVTNLSLTRVQAASNHTGIAAFGATATVWLSQSTVAGNVVSFDANGVIMSYGDNYLAADNGAPIGSLTSVARQ